MREINGDLWDFLDKPNHRICITTNGDINSKGELVMGRGCAYQAKQKWPQLPKILAEQSREDRLKVNLVYLPSHFLVTFPVKYHWNENASLYLIKDSAISLNKLSQTLPHLTFILPKPGCGNGGLYWEDVRKVIEPILSDQIFIIDF